jgi:hypothetical protein
VIIDISIGSVSKKQLELCFLKKYF